MAEAVFTTAKRPKIVIKIARVDINLIFVFMK
jgi:hypothetical protein